jgi:hypothetical protein
MHNVQTSSSAEASFDLYGRVIPRPKTMKPRLSREVLIVSVVAVAAAVAGAAGMYGYLELEHQIGPEPLSGSFSNVVIGRAQYSGLSGPYSLPYVNASLMLTTPVSFNPQEVEVTVHVPNDSLVLPNGTRASGWSMQYDPGSYPHWLVEGYFSGEYTYWTGLTATFVNPDGGVVGTFNTSLPHASSIESGAVMTVSFPSNFSSLSGVTVILNSVGYTGALELAIT